MSQIWKVTWSPKLYDYKKLIEDFTKNQHSGIIFQSKGRAHMVNLPKIDDIVYVSCNKQHIMTCTIISNFINNGNEANIDSYNKGFLRIHSSNMIYLTMKIDLIHTNPDYLRGHQCTWCSYFAP